MTLKRLTFDVLKHPHTLFFEPKYPHKDLRSLYPQSLTTELNIIEVTILCLSNYNKKGANMNNRTMEYGWRQNKDYVVGATC